MKGRLLLTGRVLGAILWRWRRTGPKAVLKVTRRTRPSELSTGVAGTTILDSLLVHPLAHYGGDEGGQFHVWNADGDAGVGRGTC